MKPDPLKPCVVSKQRGRLMPAYRSFEFTCPYNQPVSFCPSMCQYGKATPNKVAIETNVIITPSRNTSGDRISACLLYTSDAADE